MGPCIRATVIYFSLQFYLQGYIHIFTYLTLLLHRCINIFFMFQLSSINQILATQLGDGMMFSVNRFLQADLDGNLKYDLLLN